MADEAPVPPQFVITPCPFLFCQNPIVRGVATQEIAASTLTLKLHVLELPHESTAVQVTGVLPTAKHVVLFTTVLPTLHVTVGVPPQLSVAVGKVTVEQHLPEAAVALITPDDENVGFVVSFTVIVWVQVLV